MRKLVSGVFDTQWDATVAASLLTRHGWTSSDVSMLASDPEPAAESPELDVLVGVSSPEALVDTAISVLKRCGASSIEVS